jgi:hypothetical protein
MKGQWFCVVFLLFGLEKPIHLDLAATGLDEYFKLFLPKYGFN